MFEFFLRNKKKFDYSLYHDSPIDDIIEMFETLKNTAKPSIMTVDHIFNLLFIKKEALNLKLKELAQLLAQQNIEMNFKIFRKNQLFCSIETRKNKGNKILRVMHYMYDGLLGVTELVPL